MRKHPLTAESLRHHVRLLRWLVPAGLMVLVIVYELGPAHWIHDRYGFAYHNIIDIVTFALLGPLVVFAAIELLARWLDERDTSDLQSRLLADAREEAKECRRLADSAMQVLFSAGALVTLLKEESADLPPELAERVEATQSGLEESMHQIRQHLLK